MSRTDHIMTDFQQSEKRKRTKKNERDIFILDDNLYELGIHETQKNKQMAIEQLPDRITGTFNEDYNILYIDDIIQKKLAQEKITEIPRLKLRYKQLETSIKQPQTYILRTSSLDEMDNITNEIRDIETGVKLQEYNESVKDIIMQYKQYKGLVKTIIFDVDDKEKDNGNFDEIRERIVLIDKYLDIAKKYIDIDVVRVNGHCEDSCLGCNSSLTKDAINENGILRCLVCQAEYSVMILSKLSKDGTHISNNGNLDDESIDNFLRGFVRYQGLQSREHLNDALFSELDNYFIQHGRPTGDEIKHLPLNNRGRRGDTTHKMLWTALSYIGRSELYEDTNLIGHLYWGWTIHNLMHHKERIISDYTKTQKVFYQIPPEERGRTSSLGTQFRLWRHLQLIGHECYQDEFKIAENSESMRTHNRLWKLMCEGANDPNIYYIQ